MRGKINSVNQLLMVSEIVTAVELLIFFAIIKKFINYYGLRYLIVANAAFVSLLHIYQ